MDCLVEKFLRHKELTPDEIAFLVGLQAREQALPAGREFVVQGECSRNLFVLKRGWAFSYKLLANGRRQVLEILLPGDVIGLREFAFDGALNSVSTATMAVVCPFPRARLADFYRHHGELAGVLLDIACREQAILVERIADIGARPAYQRVAHLLAELYVRLGGRGMRAGADFEMPLGQVVIGDALGLSRVHVARTLGQLRRAGIVEVARRRVTVPDEAALFRAAEFDALYLESL